MFSLLSVSAFAQSRNRNKSEIVRDLAPEEATARWSEFLRSRPAKDYVFAFELEHLPRTSESTIYTGVILGKYLSSKNFLLRVDISKKDDSQNFKKFVIANRNGVQNVIVYDGKNFKFLTNEDEFLTPLLEGLIYTPFDLLMPFKSWECKYAGAGRVGRAVHFYDLLAPENFSKEKANLSKVRVALSREFNAPFETQYFDKVGEISKVVNLDSVKKIDDNWIVKKIEIVDKKSKDKDRITIIDAKFFDSLESEFFTKDALSKEFLMNK